MRVWRVHLAIALSIDCGPFLRPDQCSQRWPAPRRSRAAERPAAKQLYPDGRERDGMLGSVGGVRVWAVITLLLVLTASHGAAVVRTDRLHTACGLSGGQPVCSFRRRSIKRFAIPVNWIDFGYQHRERGQVHIRSPKGATGLMQIMPATWAEIRLRCDLGNDVFDPPWVARVFAASNAGPSCYEEHSQVALPTQDASPWRKAC